MSRKRVLLPILWGAGIGIALASYFHGASSSAGLAAGDRIVFTLVLPLLALFACLGVSLVLSGRNGAPRP